MFIKFFFLAHFNEDCEELFILHYDLMYINQSK